MFNFLKDTIAQIIAENYQQNIPTSAIQINATPADYVGDCTIVVFPFTKFSKLNPEATGNFIGEKLKEKNNQIESYNVVKGFLNIVFNQQFWLNELSLAKANTSFGQLPATGRKVMVEYSSPNTNKPLHLGHIRNNLLGYSIAAILKACGNEVIKTTLVNDRGIHICKSMLAWQKFGNGETPASSGLKGDHLVGKYYVEFDKAYKAEIKSLMENGMNEDDAAKNSLLMKETQQMLLDWEAGKPKVMELWRMMNGWVYDGFTITYQKLGVDFDKAYYESNTYLLGKSAVAEGLQQGVFVQDEDKSVWIDLTADGLDRKILQRRDGTSVYITQDIGTAQLKYDDYKMDESIYVVGNEQDYHFKVLQLICKKLGKSYADGIYHMSYGMVELPSGKMKSREGTVVDADDLMQEMIDAAAQTTTELGKVDGLNEQEKEKLFYTIGMGALKYFLLKVDPKKKMMFNPEESIELQGNTGPFIQYTHARICSILRNNTLQRIALEECIKNYNLHPAEKALIQEIYLFPTKIEEAGKEHNPAVIANYTYGLAKEFNSFYDKLSVLKAENEIEIQFRLHLVEMVAKVINQSMKLLGIEVPEKM
jgi:arginyl-tRNA synthetase